MSARIALILASMLAVAPVLAQQTPTLPPPGSLGTPPAVPNPLQPAPEASKPDAQPPSTTVPQTSDQVRPTEMGGPTDMILDARPMVSLKGQTTWDDGFEALTEAMQKVEQESKRLALKTTGKVKTAFLSTDDFGFRYEAFIEYEQAAGAPSPAVSKDFMLGQSPSGRALKFTHTGPYDDIDTTYEAITAYLDEKGAKARNLFVEEYVKTPKSSEDPELEMNIYILVE